MGVVGLDRCERSRRSSTRGRQSTTGCGGRRDARDDARGPRLVAATRAGGLERARAALIDSIDYINSDFRLIATAARASRSSIDARERSRGRRRRAWTGVVDRVARTRAGEGASGNRATRGHGGGGRERRRRLERARERARGGEGDDARRGSKAWVTSLAGAIAGASARVCVAPLDVVKIRLQVQLEAGAAGKYRGLTHAVSTILREEGVRAMWAGTTPALLLWVPYTAIQFTVLNAFKDAADEWERARPGSTRGVPMNFIGGAVAGSAATVVTYPFDVIRTLLASQGHPKVYKGILDAAAGVARERGARAACTRASR